MEKHTLEIDLGGLAPEVVAVVRPFAEELLSGLSGRIEALALAGSCLTGDYIPGVSDINSVVVLQGIALLELDVLSSTFAHFRRKLVRVPLVVTEEYIRRSLDCFPIEFLDLKLFHKTIYGPDPFSGLAVEASTLRLQCEHDLKGKLIHLRRGYIACAGKPQDLKALLLEAFPGYFPLLRAMLSLVQKNAAPPAGKASVLDEAESAFNLSLAGLRDILALKAEKKWFSSDHRRFSDLFAEVCRITHDLSVTMDSHTL
ncbi:MAG: hypothetical protein LLG43_10175 [Deltaproteobacteria bacterium]|nr:hypothetical protein [Deltaproteobacteria bacterium]